MCANSIGEPIGEYEHRNDKWSREVARSVFLQRAQILKPEIITDLRGEPFELYQEARSKFSGISFVEWLKHIRVDVFDVICWKSML